MLKLKKVAITGGIASGKSAVCKVFQDLGALVVNADSIVHELLLSDTDLSQQIVRLLGRQVLENGKLSRRLIADKVFKDPEILYALEKLLHPAVLHRIEEICQKAEREGSHRLFVVENPLLYEIGQQDAYDAIVAVLADEKKCKERFSLAGHSCEEYERRMKRQWHPEQKAHCANYVIYNNGSLEDLRCEVKKIHEELLKP